MSLTPYPGLRPFREDEADIFFGREEQIRQLLRKITKSRFVAVVGLSGCGKSSLVRAGLLPELKTISLAEAGIAWRTITMTPGDHPMRNLAKALVEQAAFGGEQNAQFQAEQIAFLLATLRRGTLGLIEVLTETPLPENTRLLIVLDQFEEIFRYSKKSDVAEANAFIALLLASLQQTQFPVYVVLTMRSDFLGECPFFPGLPEMMNDNQFLTPRLTREQCRAAIVGPADILGGSVEPRLVNHLLNEIGSDPDQLPVLQHCLMRMWFQVEKKSTQPIILTMEEYNTVGGLPDALSNHADEAYNELDEIQKKIAECLFRRLSERGAEQRDTRHPVPVSEVAAVAQVLVTDAFAVVEVFRHPERCFITPAVPNPLESETVLDLSHESLIRQWRQLKGWAEDEATLARNYRRLEQTACLWKQGKAGLWDSPDLENALTRKHEQSWNPEWAKRYGEHFETVLEFLNESEAKQERTHQEEKEKHQLKERRRWQDLIFKIVSFGLIISVVFLSWALWERNNAEEAKIRTEKALESAKEQRRLAEIAGENARAAQQQAEEAKMRTEKALESAEEQRRIAEIAGENARAAQQQAEEAKTRAEKALESAEEQRRLAEIAGENARTAQQQAEQALQKVQEANIQIANEKDRAEDALKQAEKNRIEAETAKAEAESNASTLNGTITIIFDFLGKTGQNKTFKDWIAPRLKENEALRTAFIRGVVLLIGSSDSMAAEQKAYWQSALSAMNEDKILEFLDTLGTKPHEKVITIKEVRLIDENGSNIPPLPANPPFTEMEIYFVNPSEKVAIEVDLDPSPQLPVSLEYLSIQGKITASEYIASNKAGDWDFLTIRVLDSTQKIMAQKLITIRVENY